MASTKRCGNCELLERSSTPGLATYGKCPHRDGWVRVHDEPCELHQGEPSGPLVRYTIFANLFAVALGMIATIAMDVRFGTALTHGLLVFAGIVVAVFVWYARRDGLLGEDPKFELLDREELPPEEDRRPPSF
jgi:hypothetical protein